MTRAGVLGPSSRVHELNQLPSTISVEWGVDSVAEAVSRVRARPIDVLLTEASVGFLTDEVLQLVPQSVGHIFAIAETEIVSGWADSLSGVTAIRSFAEVQEPSDHNSRDVPPSSQAAGAESRVIAVWGPVGAPGVTTTAISLATVCSASGLSTVLCDVDTRGSAIAIALGIADETPGFAAACRLAGRNELSEAEIVRVASRVDESAVSFSVLSGLPRASRWAEVAPSKAQVVIATLRNMFDVVVIDVGFGIEENEWNDDAPQRDGTARDIIRRADAVVAVGSADAVGISRLIRGLDELRDLCETPILVLNRAERSAGHEATDAIHRFTDHRVRAVIPQDSRTGVHDAVARAKSHPTLWREIARQVGVVLPEQRRRRLRR